MSESSTTIQVRLPRTLRDDATAALADMGLDLPTAVRIYLIKVAKTRRIPFPLESDPGAEAIPVDRPIQSQMDRIGKAWKKAQSEQ